MIILLFILVLVGYMLFHDYCKNEWQSEDIDVLLTEGTGHD